MACNRSDYRSFHGDGQSYASGLFPVSVTDYSLCFVARELMSASNPRPIIPAAARTPRATSAFFCRHSSHSSYLLLLERGFLQLALAQRRIVSGFVSSFVGCSFLSAVGGSSGALSVFRFCQGRLIIVPRFPRRRRCFSALSPCEVWMPVFRLFPCRTRFAG